MVRNASAVAAAAALVVAISADAGRAQEVVGVLPPDLIRSCVLAVHGFDPNDKTLPGFEGSFGRFCWAVAQGYLVRCPNVYTKREAWRAIARARPQATDQKVLQTALPACIDRR